MKTNRFSDLAKKSFPKLTVSKAALSFQSISIRIKFSMIFYCFSSNGFWFWDFEIVRNYEVTFNFANIFSICGIFSTFICTDRITFYVEHNFLYISRGFEGELFCRFCKIFERNILKKATRIENINIILFNFFF